MMLECRVEQEGTKGGLMTQYRVGSGGEAVLGLRARPVLAFCILCAKWIKRRQVVISRN